MSNSNNKPSNGEPNPAQRAAIVSDALSALSHEFKPMTETAAMELMRRATEIAKAVKAIANPILDNKMAFGKQHDVKVLSHVISKAYTEGFSNWSKDELLYLLVLIHTETAIEAITGETNTHRIIKL